MISVIIPVYNAQNTLNKCIDSILSQSYKDYEIILIDDGSTDRSPEICDEYANANTNISVVHQKNSGPATARKNGVALAKGSFLAFCDSDDYYLTDAFNILTDNLSGFDIVCGQPTPPIGKVSNTLLQNENDIIAAYFDTRILHGSYWGSLFKKSLFDDVDFCDNTSIGEDVNTILQVYINAKSINVISNSVYSYKRNTSSISNNGYTPRHKEGFLKYIEYRKLYCNRYPVYKDTIAAFYTEFEMAVFTAMCRNNNYDDEVIQLLKQEIKENQKALNHNPGTAAFYKISAFLILFNHKLFALMFKAIRKFVGR